MDIYQIWTTYNKQWSRYEILAFGLVLTVVCIGMAVCVYRKKLRIIQASAVVALVVFLGIVFGSTVFTRIGTVRQYELLPFWSWREVICNHDRELLKENLLNFILLLPAGILLPLIANHKIKWYPVSYTHLRAHETDSYLVCRLLLEKKKKSSTSLGSIN